MSGFNLLVLLITLAGAVCLMTLISRLWSLGGSEQQPVGPLRSPRPQPPLAPIVPGNFRALITGEAENWRNEYQWSPLANQLDELEVSLGGTPGDYPQPDTYSSEWLDLRIQRIEKLAGPLPAPLRAPVQTKQPSRKRWFNT